MIKENREFFSVLLAYVSGAFAVGFLPFLLVGPPDWWDYGPYWWPFALFATLSVAGLVLWVRARRSDK
jgi:hypothetical protein